MKENENKKDRIGKIYRLLGIVLFIAIVFYYVSGCSKQKAKEQEEKEQSIVREAYNEGWNDLLDELNNDLPDIDGILDDAVRPEDLEDCQDPIGEYFKLYEALYEAYQGSKYYQREYDFKYGG